MNLIKKSVIAAGLAATALTGTMVSTPAMARDWHRGRDNTAAVAIGAGILGLAVGAIAASANDRGRYYDRDRVVTYRQEYYRDGYDRRYERDAYDRRYDAYRGEAYGRDYDYNRGGYGWGY